MELKGIDGFIAELESFDEELNFFQEILKEEVRKAVRKATRDVERIAVSLAPEDTGRLKNSASSRVEGFEGFVEFDTPYAAAQEFGSGIAYWGYPYKIEPKNKEVLKFEINGRTVFADEVMHPGVRPQPYLRPAIRKTAKHFEDYLEDAIQNALDRVF